jgi:molybdopterin/thiamine biosynthesis adenylyltransferase
VKDRWSRYIGAMGVEAVSKQSKASILLLGLGGLGVEIAKNIVLSGCREFAVWDDQETQWSDLSGQFFLGEADLGKSRLEGTIYKLQELNHYVKVSKFDYNSADLSLMGRFQVVVATGLPHGQQLKID